MRTLKYLTMLCFATLLLFACNNANKRSEPDKIINTEDNRLEEDRKAEEVNEGFVAVVKENPDLSTFYENLEKNELTQSFSELNEPITVFVPVNIAYDSLPQAQKDKMANVENQAQNQARIYYLMVEGEMTADKLKQEIENNNGKYTLNTMQGENITAISDGDTVILTDAQGNTATIIDADMEAGNGVVHIIDGVLLPSDPTQNEALDNSADTNNSSSNM